MSLLKLRGTTTEPYNKVVGINVEPCLNKLDVDCDSEHNVKSFFETNSFVIASNLGFIDFEEVTSAEDTVQRSV